MEYLKFASDLSLDKAIVFNSVEENEETMHRLGVKQEIRQLGKGKFRSDFAAHCVQQTEFYSDRFNKALSVFLEVPQDVIYFLFPRTVSGDFRVCGKDISTETMLVMPAGSVMDATVPDLSGSDTFVISQARFNTLTEIADPTFNVLAAFSAIDGNNPILRRIRELIVNLAGRAEYRIDQEGLDNLLVQVIAWVSHAVSGRPPEKLVNNSARANVAKKIQEYIEENYRVAVSLEYICKYAAVGVRTAQRCFVEYFGLTISEYLQVVRLDSARRELFVSSPQDTTVGLIAFNSGFNHLGRFSVQFRQRFGMPPRQALLLKKV